MKKILKIMLLLLIGLMLVSCGNKKDDKSSNEGGNTKKKLKVAAVFSGSLKARLPENFHAGTFVCQSLANCT